MQIKQNVLLENAEYEERLALQEVLTSVQSNESTLIKLRLSVAEDTIETNQRALKLLERQLNLEQSISSALKKQNRILKEKKKSAEEQAKLLRCSQAEAMGEYRTKEEHIRAELDHIRSEFSSTQSRIASLREQLALSERTAAAAQERAALAEQTLRQREALAHAHAEVQHSSQDLERRSRAEADARAAAAEARATTLEKEILWLQRQLEMKNRRVSGLEQVIKRKDDVTPAKGKAVDEALNAVEEFVSQLDSSPEIVKQSDRRLAKPEPIKVDLAKIERRPKARHGGRERRRRIQESSDDDAEKSTSSDESDASDFENELKGCVRLGTSARVVTKRKAGAVKDAGSRKEQKKKDAGVEKDKNENVLKRIRPSNDDDDGPSRPAVQREASDKENLSGNFHDGVRPLMMENKLAEKPLGALNPQVIAAAKQHSQAPPALKPMPLKPLLSNPFASNLQGDAGKRRLLGVSRNNATAVDRPHVSMLYKTTSNNFQAPKIHLDQTKK